MAQKAGAPLLSDLLARLEIELKNKGVPVPELAMPGADPERIRSDFDAVGLTVPDEVIVWFSWHDGPLSESLGPALLPKFTFYSHAEAIKSYQSGYGLSRGTEPWEWDPDWFELMGEPGGLAVNCAAPRDHPPLIRAIDFAAGLGTSPEAVELQAVSLCTLVTWWIEALRNEWVAWDMDRKYSPWHWSNEHEPESRAQRVMA
jgi:hypothetical protein